MNNDILLEESKKENLLYSKELSELIQTNSHYDHSEGLYCYAVFNNKKITLEYISAKFKKNRVKIKTLCEAFHIDTIINEMPISIVIMLKEKEIKAINILNKNEITLSISKKDHKYIIGYTLKIE